MFLKNYTSNVPVSQTIYRIEQVLIKCGVGGIEKEYTSLGKVLAITFRIELEPGKPMFVRLPVNEEQALQALWSNYVGDDWKYLSPDKNSLSWQSRLRKKKSDFADQAERTAWKIIQDWVEVQMSMVQMKQADFREVFLPYFWDGKRTFFTMVKDSGFRALLPEKTE